MDIQPESTLLGTFISTFGPFLFLNGTQASSGSIAELLPSLESLLQTTP